MCAFGADGRSDGHSPDRVDALVWALTELLLNDVTPKMRRL
jgi:phage terminase large subunit-like protein